MKKFISIIMALAMLVTCIAALSGCGAKSGHIKIGVIMYGYTDEQGKSTQEYCSYLAENFDVEFVYEKTDYNDDAHISCVENLISAGCKAIISAYDTSLESSIQTCESAGVYYVLALDYASPSDANNVNSKYFLGGTKQFGGNEADLGKTYGEAFLNSGLTNVSGVSFPAFAFVEATPIYEAFRAVVTSSGKNTVSDLVYSSGFSPADVKTATASAINKDTQAIFGLASGLDYVYPELKNNHPGVKLIALGYNSSVASLFDAGSLIAAGTNNYPQSIASCFVRIMNAIAGKSYSDAASGAYNQKDGNVNVVNGVAGYPVFTDKASLADFETYALGRGSEGMSKGAVTADEIRKVLLTENSEATLADLNALTNRTVEQIKASR
ncbi:MAG: hypothetical protein ACI4QR_02590 [Eubacteriales bacterium]